MPLVEGKLLYSPNCVYVSKLGRTIVKPAQWSEEHKDRLRGELLGREFSEEVIDEIEEVSKGLVDYVRSGERDVIHEIIFRRIAYQIVSIRGELKDDDKEELIKIADDSFL